MCELRVAGAEDQIRLDVGPNLGFEGRLNVDLGEDAEALCGERLPHLGHGFVVGQIHLDGQRIVHDWFSLFGGLRLRQRFGV